MNLAPYPQLLWKEYRAARAFWLALVVLVVGAQAATLWLSDDVTWNARWMTNLGLAAPAFFALGCAGAAFAVEREERTFDFLEAAPVSAGKVFAAKLGLAALATLAMFVLLWPVTLVFTGGQMPEAAELVPMLGLWLPAAAEALAWGAFFSLLMARPLVAISLALFTTTTIVHLTAWSVAPPGTVDFTFAPYLTALPWRGLFLAAVLGADVYLVWRWLRGGVPRPFGAKAKMRDAATQPAEADLVANLATIEKISARPDRGPMLASLFWQQWRQSARMMFLMAGLQVALTLVALGLPEGEVAGMLAIAMIAATAGSHVFLPDQERHQYRYFVEHNIPPRLVWLSRQLPWIGVLFISTTIAFVVWIGPGNVGRLVYTINLVTDRDRPWVPYWEQWRELNNVFLPAVKVGLAAVVVSYAAGQWTSMMIRSGLLAGLFGTLLAAALTGWAWLMFLLEVSWWWSVLPIPLVLLGATWLRAPDWIRENRSWAARARAGACVVVPALVLLIAVPTYRVQSAGLVEPGFDPAAYEARVTPEALATGELYHRANELFQLAEEPIRFDPKELGAAHDRAPTKGQLEWLKQNAEPLALVLEASRRPSCCLDDPAKLNDTRRLRNAGSLILLVLLSGRELEFEGKLAEALDRYFLALRVISQWTEFGSSTEDDWTFYRGRLLSERWNVVSAGRVFWELAGWSAHQGQTNSLLRAAIGKLQGVDGGILHPADAIKSDYILLRHFIQGDPAAIAAMGGTDKGGSTVARHVFWSRLLPWEKYRELRSLNVATDHALWYVNTVQQHLRSDRSIRHVFAGDRPRHLFLPFQTDLRISDLSISAATVLAGFEAHRRATLLTLAISAYRLEHGELPPLLDALVPQYLDKLPVDPYSGFDFVYFRDGIPQPQTPLETVELEETRSGIVPGKPCLWCTGPRLYARTLNRRLEDDEPPKPPEEAIVYYVPADEYEYPSQLPTYTAWGRGLWFPLPERE